MSNKKPKGRRIGKKRHQELLLKEAMLAWILKHPVKFEDISVEEFWLPYGIKFRIKQELKREKGK